MHARTNKSRHGESRMALITVTALGGGRQIAGTCTPSKTVVLRIRRHKLWWQGEIALAIFLLVPSFTSLAGAASSSLPWRNLAPSWNNAGRLAGTRRASPSFSSFITCRSAPSLWPLDPVDSRQIRKCLHGRVREAAVDLINGSSAATGVCPPAECLNIFHFPTSVHIARSCSKQNGSRWVLGWGRAECGCSSGWRRAHCSFQSNGIIVCCDTGRPTGATLVRGSTTRPIPQQ